MAHAVGDEAQELGAAPAPATVKQRVRRWAPKSRTGCAMCRKRRVKCDEAWPRCRRCVAAGVACGRYLDSDPGSTPLMMPQGLSDSPAPVDLRPSPMDMRIFDLLRTETIPQIAGPFDQSFWAVDVLQACRQHPAIWHGNLALAAMNKQRTIGGRADSDTDPSMRSERWALYSFALQQYSCAVAQVLEITRKPVEELAQADKEAVILAAILLTAISVLKDNMNEAKAHAEHCSKLFHSWGLGTLEQASMEPTSTPSSEQNQACRRSRPSPIKAGALLRTESLVALVTHFEGQFFNNLDPGALVAWGRPKAPFLCRQRRLASVGEAYYEFTMLFGGLLFGGLLSARFSEQNPGVRPPWAPAVGPEEDDEMHYRSEFRVWRTRFNALRLCTFRGRPADERGLRVLELLWTGVAMLLDMDLSSPVMGWDAMRERFWELYRGIDDYLLDEALCQGGNDGSGFAGGFSFSMSVGLMLEFIGSKCRDTVLRHKAVDRLRTLPHQDGTFDPRMMAAVIEGVVLLEESAVLLGEAGCRCVRGEFVCEDHRILDCRIEFLDKRRMAHCSYSSMAELKTGGLPSVVTLKW